MRKQQVPAPAGKWNRREGERGAALVMTLVFLVIFTLIGILIIDYSSTGSNIAREIKQDSVLVETTDMAIEQVKTNLWALYPWDANLAVGQVVVAETPLDNSMTNYLLTRQTYNVRVDNINGPDLVKVTATATNSDTGQAKQVEVVLHYYAVNVDQAGQGAENSNVIN
jgi:hypothetical protein